MLVLWLGCAPWFAPWTVAGSSHPKDPPGVSPEERFPVGPLGYRPPGPLYMLSGRAFSSLDFIDAHHLLFTFHLPRLMRREPNPDRFEDDQIIQAVILSVPGGTVQ